MRQTRPDFVAAALWCLAHYDLDLRWFAEMREHLPEAKYASACVHIERALMAVLEAKTNAMADINSGYQQIIAERLGATTETVIRAHDTHPHLVSDFLSSYAMMLGALSSYGPGVWERYKAMVDEMWETTFASTTA
jgi:hypothetical protein